MKTIKTFLSTLFVVFLLIGASFAQTTATVVVAVNPLSSGYVTGGGDYEVGSNATLTAIATNHWDFLMWSDAATNNPYIIIVDSNILYTATFTRKTSTFSVAVNNSNGGTVSGGGIHGAGTNVIISATASNGWTFGMWSDTETNNPYTILVPDTNITYTAMFTQNPTSTCVSCTSTNIGGTNILTFASSGNFVIISGVFTSKVLVVAGGGAGGTSGYGNGFGGGGGGGQVILSNVVLNVGTNIVIVGEGGAGTGALYVNGNDGKNSSLGSVIASCGKGGKVGYPSLGGNSGSGKNGGDYNSQKGFGSGGGAGDTQNGGSSYVTNINQFVGAIGGSGGNGTPISAFGNSTNYYGAGGGGMGNLANGIGGIGGGGAGGTNGVANTGGGGGGANGDLRKPAALSSGGSGIVIISFPQ